ncbi:hypothetical protein M8C21_005626, partial [Ambrosia artemisiifolia]
MPTSYVSSKVVASTALSFYDPLQEPYCL